jgi:O-antigen/teichoic acid export membrane protein
VGVLKNTSWLMLFQVLGRLVSILTTIVIVRTLGASDFGKYTLALTLVGLIASFAYLGLDSLATREIPRDHDKGDHVLAGSLLIKVLSSVGAIGISLGIGKLLALPSDTFNALAIISITLLFNSLVNSAGALYYGLEKMALGAALVFAQSAVILAFIVLAIKGLAGGLWAVIVAYTAGCAVSGLIAGIMIVPRLRRGLNSSFGLSEAMVMVKEALPFLALGFSLMMYYKVDIIILSKLKGDVSVGEYSAAYRILDSLMFIPAALMGALFPTLSRLFVESKAALSQVCIRSVRYLSMLGIPAATGIALLSDKIIYLLYGPVWENAISPLRILIWAWALIFINCVCPVALNATNRTKTNVFVTFVGIGANIVLNLILIPFLNIIGASLANVGTEIVSSCLYFYFINKYVCRINPFDFAWKPFVASIAMASGLLTLKSQISNVVILVIVGVALYIGFLTILRGFDKTDREIVQSLWQRIGSTQKVLRSTKIHNE